MLKTIKVLIIEMTILQLRAIFLSPVALALTYSLLLNLSHRYEDLTIISILILHKDLTSLE
jgi:hypothetical protein